MRDPGVSPTALYPAGEAQIGQAVSPASHPSISHGLLLCGTNADSTDREGRSDFDNDGDLDVLVMNRERRPSCCEMTEVKWQWLKVKVIGTKFKPPSEIGKKRDGDPYGRTIDRTGCDRAISSTP